MKILSTIAFTIRHCFKNFSVVDPETFASTFIKVEEESLSSGKARPLYPVISVKVFAEELRLAYFNSFKVEITLLANLCQEYWRLKNVECCNADRFACFIQPKFLPLYDKNSLRG